MVSFWGHQKTLPTARTNDFFNWSAIFFTGIQKFYCKSENVFTQILMVKREWIGDIPNFCMAYVQKWEKVEYFVNKRF